MNFIKKYNYLLRKGLLYKRYAVVVIFNVPFKIFHLYPTLFKVAGDLRIKVAAQPQLQSVDTLQTPFPHLPKINILYVEAKKNSGFLFSFTAITRLPFNMQFHSLNVLCSKMSTFLSPVSTSLTSVP